MPRARVCLIYRSVPTESYGKVNGIEMSPRRREYGSDAEINERRWCCVGSREAVMADQTTRQWELRKVEANEGGGYETG